MSSSSPPKYFPISIFYAKFVITNSEFFRCCFHTSGYENFSTANVFREKVLRRGKKMLILTRITYFMYMTKNESSSGFATRNVHTSKMVSKSYAWNSLSGFFARLHTEYFGVEPIHYFLYITTTSQLFVVNEQKKIANEAVRMMKLSKSNISDYYLTGFFDHEFIKTNASNVSLHGCNIFQRSSFAACSHMIMKWRWKTSLMCFRCVDA